MNKKEVEREWARMHPVLHPLMCIVMIIGFQKIYADVGLFWRGEAFSPYGYIVPVFFGIMVIIGQAFLRSKRKAMASELSPGGDVQKAAPQE